MIAAPHLYLSRSFAPNVSFVTDDGLIVNLMDVELPLEPSVVVKHARLGKNANYNPSSAARPEQPSAIHPILEF